MTSIQKLLRHRTDILIIVALGFISAFLMWPINPPSTWNNEIQFGDASILAYILSWGSYALFNEPWNYYNIPLGYPGHTVLAGMDGMIFQSILVSPFWYLTKSTPLVYNLSIYFSFWFCLAAGYLSTRLIIKSRWISVTAAIVYVVTSDRYFHANGHTNLIYTGFIPLTFAFTYAALIGRKRAYLVLASLSLGISVYASNYLFVLTALAFIIAIFCWAVAHNLQFTSIAIKRILIMGIIGVIIASPIPMIHYNASRKMVSQRADIATASTNEASTAGWLKPPNYKDFVKSRDAVLMGIPDEQNTRGEDNQFIGFMVLFLLGLEVIRLVGIGNSAWSRLDKLSCSLLVISGVLMLASFGPYIQIFGYQVPGPYMLLNKLYLQFTGFFRIPTRLAFVTQWLNSAIISIMLYSKLAGHPYRKAMACMAIMAATCFEHISLTAVPRYSTFNSELIHKLDELDPSGQEVCVIAPDPGNLGPHAFSTTHNWRPMANAWADNPLLKHYTWFFTALEDLPSTQTGSMLTDRGISWIISTTPEFAAKAKQSSFLKQEFETVHGSLFRLVNPDELRKVSSQAKQVAMQTIEIERKQQIGNTKLSLTPGSGGLTPQYGYLTNVKLDSEGLTLEPQQQGFLSANISLPGNFDPNLYDQVTIKYKLHKNSDHHVAIYWSSSSIPMSERTSIVGFTQLTDTGYEAMFTLSNHPDWIYLSKLTGFRFDITDIAVKNADTAHITEVLFERKP